MQTQSHPTLAKVLVATVLTLAFAAPAAVAAPQAPGFPQAVPSQPGELTGSSAAAESARAQERYYTSYGNPSTLGQADTSADSGGVDWPAIGISLGATIMLVGAVIALVMRSRRVHVAA